MSSSRHTPFAVVLLLICLAPPVVLADSVQGVVRNETGDPVAAVTVSLTGAAAGAQPDVFTDVSGAYFASVPPDTYTVIYTAPPAAGLVPDRVTGVVVAGATILGDRILRFGLDVTGLVTDPLGAPVEGVDLRYADLATGNTIYTPLDDTDAAGQYAVFVPPGTYKVEFRPPVLVDLAPVQLNPVQIQIAGAQPTVVLPEGVVVIGTVRDELADPVADVDLDFIDSATGNKIFTTRDDTNAFGVYRTVVEPGVYDMRYFPPAGSGLVAKEILAVELSSDITLPDVTLVAGLEFRGKVVNVQSVGLAAVDLNVFDASTGDLLLTPGDDTDSGGNYLVLIEPGTYDVRYTPPVGPPYLPQRIDGILVTADVVRPDVVLDLGFLVSGSTVDPAMQPVAGVDLDFKDTQTGDRIFVTRDDSDHAGQFAVAVPGATYRIDFDPPAGSNLLPLSLPDVLVDQDVYLGQVVLEAPVSIFGVVQDEAGTPLAGVRVEIRDEATGEVLLPPNDLTDAAGFFGATVPPGTYRVYLEPAPGTSFFPLLTDAVQVDADLDLGVLVLTGGFAVGGVVVDPDGAAIAGVTVRAVEDSSGPGSGGSTFVSLTDAAGRFEMLVAPGDYQIVYDPVGLPFLRLATGPLTIGADTTLPRAVLQRGWTVSGRAVDDTPTGVAGVDVDLLDAATGANIPLQGDLTDTDGFFGVKVAAGTYRLRLQPDPASGFFEIETQAFAVAADVDVGDLLLPRGVTVDGTVGDSFGAPIPDVGVAFNPEPGNLHPDRVTVMTDGTGFFSASVPEGDYRVRYTPPPDSNFFALEIGPLLLTADTTLPAAVLDTGFRVSGRVIDNQLTPVAGVDIDLLDAVTGQSLPLQDDLTDVAGGFDVLIHAGAYVVRVEPDPATRLLPLLTGVVVVDADVNVGDLSLDSGVLLSGDVVDEAAAGIAGVGIDAVDANTGFDALLVGDRTDALGTFLTAVAPGDYFVEYRPPMSTAYVAQRVGPVTVSGDTQLPTVTLPTGTLVSGVVLDPGLAPLAGVETEWRFAGTCDLAFTVRDATDAAGHFEVALLPGTYDVTLVPPPGSGLFAERVLSVVASGDAVALPAHTLSSAPPPIERCNSLDDDCDGQTDEAFPDLGSACSAGVGACETSGVLVCGDDGTQSVCDAVPGVPSTEVCDAIDNDCDGVADEGCSTSDNVLVVEPTTLSWNAVPEATGYDVVQGDLGLLRASGFTASVSTCLAEDTTATLLGDVNVPASGRGFWILVRANTATGPGSYGDGMRDQEIAASPLACAP